MSKIVKIPAPANLGIEKKPKYIMAGSAYSAQYAANHIKKSFDWEQTAEGAAFWAGIYHRLEQIANDGIIKEL